MAIFASDKGSGSDFEPAPAGNHLARCVWIIDLGTTKQEYLGQVSYPHKIFIQWELPNEMKTFQKDGEEITEPFTVAEFYTLSLNEKANLTPMLESWRGKAFTELEKAQFDITVLAGIPCMLNVVHKTNQSGKTRAKAASASPLPKGFECPPQFHPTVLFSLADFSEESFGQVSAGLQKMIEESDEYQVIAGKVGQRSAGKLPDVPDVANPHPTTNPHPTIELEMDDIPF